MILKFGDADSIKQRDKYIMKKDREEKIGIYEVDVVYSGSKRFRVEALNENEAEEKALEKADWDEPNFEIDVEDILCIQEPIGESEKEKMEREKNEDDLKLQLKLLL